jgi:hypothetical protein
MAVHSDVQRALWDTVCLDLDLQTLPVKTNQLENL